MERSKEKKRSKEREKEKEREQEQRGTVRILVHSSWHSFPPLVLRQSARGSLLEWPHLDNAELKEKMQRS